MQTAKIQQVTMGRLGRNTLILLTSNAGSAVLSFLLSVLIGRALGQDGLGVYTTALAWVFPLSLIAEFGLGTLITRDVAQQPENTADYLQTTTIVRLWLGGGLTIALVAFAPLLSQDGDVVRGIQISAPLVLILPFFGAFTAVFRAKQAMWPIPPLNLGMLIAQASLTILVFVNGGGILAALAVNTFTSAGQLAAAWWVWKRWFTSPESQPESHKHHLHTLSLLKKAWPFALAAVLAALSARLGTILLERLTDTSSVGYYAAATRFVEAGRVIPNALFGALFPLLAALSAQPEIMRQNFRRVMTGLAGFGVVMGVGFSLFTLPILSLTYGAAFAPAVQTLQLAMWSLLPGLLRGGQTLYWYARGKEQFVNWVTGGVLVAQILLSLWLIPAHGAEGAAVVSLITETIASVILWGWGYVAAR
ncbi:MAG: flippase [Anaerolineae bacterium]|nr:flippase [Anaerolineae bacterium]